MAEPLLRLESVSMHYPGADKKNRSVALDHISFHIYQGESIGIVGQSGAGKSTLARLILGLDSPSTGKIFIDGVNILRNRQKLEKKVQIIWQDSSQYLNPIFTVARLISEPLEVSGKGDIAWRKTRIEELLKITGLENELLSRKPHELSGGQCQRVAIARALAVNPKLLICDEPFTGLDIPSQLRLMKLFVELFRKLGMTYLLISHDISVVRSLCCQIVVLQKGRIVEIGETEKIFNNPSHDYTKRLIDSSRPMLRQCLV